MQALWDALAAIFGKVFTIQSALFTMLTGSFWFLWDDLVLWVQTHLPELPQYKSSIEAFKSHLRSGWVQTGSTYLNTTMGQVHFWFGLGNVKTCIGLVLSVIVAVLIWRVTVKLIPTIG